MKKFIDTEYQEHAKFNLTRLISKNHEAGKPLSKDDLADVDFLEEGSKVLLLPINGKYGSQQRFDIKETLAENMSALLPLSYYKEYITVDWINSDGLNSFGPVKRALNDYNYEFLYEMLAVSKKHLNDNEGKTDTSHNRWISAYEHNLLSPILNVFGNLEHLKNFKLPQENYDRYFDLVKVALSDFKEYFSKNTAKIWGMSDINLQKHAANKNINEFNGSLSSFDDKSWFLEYKKMELVFRRFPKKEQVLDEVVSNPKSFNIYQDIFNQHKTKESNPFYDYDLVKLALNNLNKKVASHMLQAKPFRKGEIISIFDDVLDDWIKKERSKIHSSFDNKYVDKTTYLRTILEIVGKNNPAYEIKDYPLFSHILLSSNKKFVDSILEKYPAVMEEKLDHKLTLNQWCYAKKIFNEFTAEHNFKLARANNGCSYASFDMYYLEKLTEHVTPTRELTKDEKIAVNEVVAIYHLPRLETRVDEKEKEKLTAFHVFTLSKELENKEVEKKKMKI